MNEQGEILLQERICPAIVAYSKATGKGVDEYLFIDMLRDILSFARSNHNCAQTIINKADEISFNNYASKGGK
jgi:hypothetical protein